MKVVGQGTMVKQSGAGSGSLAAGSTSQATSDGDLVDFGPGDWPSLFSDDANAKAMLLGKDAVFMR